MHPPRQKSDQRHTTPKDHEPCPPTGYTACILNHVACEPRQRYLARQHSLIKVQPCNHPRLAGRVRRPQSFQPPFVSYVLVSKCKPKPQHLTVMKDPGCGAKSVGRAGYYFRVTYDCSSLRLECAEAFWLKIFRRYACGQRMSQSNTFARLRLEEPEKKKKLFPLHCRKFTATGRAESSCLSLHTLKSKRGEIGEYRVYFLLSRGRFL